MNYKLSSLSLIALLLGNGNVMLPPVAGTTPSPTFVSQNSSDEEFGVLTQADRWFFIAKTAIYKGDFDTGLINLRRAQRGATYDCLRDAATRSLSAAQAGKDALKNGASVEQAIKIYGQKVAGSPECW
jgi:hypothetical protein